MSFIPPLQCLFCRHLNPAGVNFCNDCGLQLNLQPCGQCGAIDDRAAKNCYKCGTGFSLPAAPELDIPFAPTVNEAATTLPALNNAKVATEQDAPSVDGTVLTNAGVSPTRPRRGMRMALPVLLLVLIAAPFYFYGGSSAQLSPKQYLAPATSATSATSAISAISAAPMPASSTGNAATARLEPELVQTSRRPQIAAGTIGLGRAPYRAAPPVDGTRTPSDPAPVAESEAQSLQHSAVLEDCPPAVATLGLCGSNPKQKGQ